MSRHIFLLIFTVLSSCLYEVMSIPRVDPLVQTKVGLIKGVKATDGDYSKFLGIPYGKIQDDNHFGPSTPYPPFEDVFLALDDSSVCPQLDDDGNFKGNIDCLHLNVYVPSNASSRNKLPVMVYIHGGRFMVNSKTEPVYGPKFLVRHDVIVVVMNYRLGAYGFMCLHDARVPGNQGLKDQRIALRWVKDNIEAFGGDAEKITVWGESAGASSVDLHALTDKESLFNKVISQSGKDLSSRFANGPDLEAHLKLAKVLGFEGGNTEETLSFLSSSSSSEVLAKAEEMEIEFPLCVENKFEDVEILIHTSPMNMTGERTKNIPVLIGTNDYETLYLYRNVDMKELGDIFRQRLEDSFNFTDVELKTLAEIVRQFYMGDEEISDEVKTHVIDFDTDFIYHHQIQRSIDTYLESGRKIFYYIFSYVGKRNYMRDRYNLTSSGATHADELGYLFDMDRFSETDKDDQLMVDRITELWTNFVKFGDPTPETSELLPNKWTPVKAGRMDYLSLDSEVQMKSRPFRERMVFWDLLYHVYAKKQKGYVEKAFTNENEEIIT